jgi:hypothetical protein
MIWFAASVIESRGFAVVLVAVRSVWVTGHSNICICHVYLSRHTLARTTKTTRSDICDGLLFIANAIPGSPSLPIKILAPLINFNGADVF